MPPEPPGGTRPAGPVVLRIKLRYDDLEAMISRFAPNVGKSGLFLPTKSLQPVGSEVKFELRLATDTPVLLGLGRVKVTKAPDPDHPKASFGMAIELMRVTRESRDLILRMLERRKQLGLPEVGIPMPADLDAARRQDLVDTAVKDAASAPIPTAIAAPDSGPTDGSSSLLTAPRRQSGPLAVAKAIEIEPLAPEPPRKKRPGLSELIERASGPIGAVTVPGLDEEVDIGAVLARARSLASAGGDLDGELEALLDSQAAPLEINVEAASAELARQLGGVAVRRGSAGWAPPPAIAESPPRIEPVDDQPEEKLEDKLEDKPETRDEDLAAKSEQKLEEKSEEKLEEKSEEKSEEKLEEKSEEKLEEKLEPLPEESAPAIAPEPADTTLDGADARPAKMHDAITDLGRSEVGAAPAVPALEDEGEAAHEEHEVEPDQIHDEIHQLGESDFEEVEHTQIGEVQSAFEEHVFATTPSMQHELAEKLDAHLAEVESESEHDDLGIGEASGHYLRSKIGLPPAEIYEGEDAPADEPEMPVVAAASPLPPEYQQDFIHRFDAADREGYEAPNAYSEDPPVAYQDPAYAEPSEYARPFDEVPAGVQAYGNETIDAYGHTVDASVLPQPADEEQFDDIEEIDDFEILAEADEDDEDLLSASGESELSARYEAPTVDPEFTLPPANDGDFELPPQRESDFAMRLDLGDDDFDAPVPRQVDPLAASAGHALAGFDDEEDPSHSFTFASPPEAVEFDEPHGSYAPGFVPPDRFDQSDVIPIAQPASPRTPKRPTVQPPPNVNWDEASSRNQWAKAPPPPENVDLESALEALDVDLDDLSTAGAPVPHAPTELARAGSSAGRATIRPPSQSDPKRKSTRGPRGRVPRASTEDGVMIDFDDDDD